MKTAVLGVTQIRHAVANSNTLVLTRVTVMPKGTICYQFHLRNNHGVPYVRTAMTEGAMLKVSGADGYDAEWNGGSLHDRGREFTSDVNEVIRR